MRITKNKIKKIKDLKKIVVSLKEKGKKIAFTNGCFDLLHLGHVAYLEKARLMADILIVAVNSDKSIRRIKGKKRPLVNEKDRIKIIAGMESVDYVVLFSEDTPLNVIKTLKPDILIKGADWDKNRIAGGDFVVKRGGKIATVSLMKGRSSSGLIKKILRAYKIRYA